MKIAHFYDGIYYQGGVSTYIRELRRIQSSLGSIVTLFETNATEPPAAEPRAILVKDERELIRLCNESSIDVLHYHCPILQRPPIEIPVVVSIHEHSPHCMSGGLFLKRRNLPCPRTFGIIGCTYGHLRDHCGSLRPHRFLQNLSKVTAQKAILPSVEVVCVGEFLRSRMIKAGYGGENITVIPNFSLIEADEAAAAITNQVTFVALGRLEKLKGFDWLLRSFARVSSPVRLTIAGQGSEETSLRALAIELGIGDRVEFAGWTSGAAKTDLIRSARAVIVPSIWHETFGLVAIEAAALGKPVIASDSGELPFIIQHGYNGTIAEAGNIDQLSGAIEEMAANAAMAEKTGQNNKEKYLRFYTAKTHIDKLNEVYSRAIFRSDSALAKHGPK